MAPESVATKTGSGVSTMIPPGKPNLAWAIWAGVVLATGALAGIIALIANKRKKIQEDKPAETPAGETKE